MKAREGRRKGGTEGGTDGRRGREGGTDGRREEQREVGMEGGTDGWTEGGVEGRTDGGRERGTDGGREGRMMEGTEGGWEGRREGRAVEGREKRTLNLVIMLILVIFAAICDVGFASFNYDMRRLSEILAFPKAWYSRTLARHLFLGEEMGFGVDSTSSGEGWGSGWTAPRQVRDGVRGGQHLVR